MGFATGNHLAPHVHPNLTQSAALTCKGVDAFGAAVEAVLIKHGELILVHCTVFAVFVNNFILYWLVKLGMNLWELSPTQKSVLQIFDILMLARFT